MPSYRNWQDYVNGITEQNREGVMSSDDQTDKSANERQVGGKHYKKMRIQHWDFAAANDLDYFQGQITKYVCRWKDKNGLEDLHKALHFLQKYIEIQSAVVEEDKNASG